jgi:hypothetical protein
MYNVFSTAAERPRESKFISAGMIEQNGYQVSDFGAAAFC